VEVSEENAVDETIAEPAQLFRSRPSLSLRYRTAVAYFNRIDPATGGTFVRLFFAMLFSWASGVR
jgi:hypothetical protein